MKNSRNIALAFMLAIFVAGCKKEAMPETKQAVAAKTEVAAENLETASLTIEGMTCAVGCAKTIETKLADTAGVSEAKVDFDTKIATVKFDKTVQSIESLTKTVEKVGGGDLYKVTKSEKSIDKV